LLTVGWVCGTSWDVVVHAHPAYAVVLVITLLGALAWLWRALSARQSARGWRRVPGIVLVVVTVAWLVGVIWLKPFAPVEPALTAMASSASVTVEETATSITLRPTTSVSDVGLFFQPGARVDARAYAAVLRPLAEAGHVVVIPKQPLGIAFLATGAFESAREANPDVREWVVGGHSLGGTVAAMDAAEHDADAQAPVTGLLLYASYPASDISTSTSAVLSISGTLDGLATPADIEASRSNLPPDAEFLALDGVVHSYFGDYGPQPGDGVPTVSQDEARTQISEASAQFMSAQEPR
jgi:hypothetical protein